MSVQVLPEIVTNGSAFASVTALFAAHNTLLRQVRNDGETSELLETAAEFILRGRMTGALIDDLDDRRAIQSMLDYWVTVLYRAGHEPPGSTLIDFDLALAPALDESSCPYRGLEAFRAPDHRLFFGRQRLIGQLTEKLQEERLLAVVGPSGSGKSSLVLGGLIPELIQGALPESDQWRYLPPLTPDRHPLESLAHALGVGANDTWLHDQVAALRGDERHLVRLLSTRGAPPAVLVVDQFEETFTLCRDEQERFMFVANLLSLTLVKELRHIVILTMRSDFISRIALIPMLQQPFQHAQSQITTLSANELRDAIERPAALVGLRFEPGVVEALVKEMVGEPAALPLLQFALLRLWRSRQRNLVTARAYTELGGAREALGRSAEVCYQNLPREQKPTAKRILLKLVRPGDREDATSRRIMIGDGVEATSSRIPLAELYAEGEDPARVNLVLEKLVDAGLVRKTGDDGMQVEVAHEAVIRNWPRLMDWLEEERQQRRDLRRLIDQTQQWENSDRDIGALLRGSLLSDALQIPVTLLDPQEKNFLRASLREQARIEAEQEAIRQRELQQIRALAEVQRQAEAEGQRAENERQRAEDRIEFAKRELEQARILTEEQRLRAEAERQRAEDRTRFARRLLYASISLTIILLVAILAALLAYRNAMIADSAQATAQANANLRATLGAQAHTAEAIAHAEAIGRRTSEARAIELQQTAVQDTARRSTSEAKALVAQSTAQAIAILSNTSEAQARAANGTAEAEVRIRETSEAEARAAQATAVVEVSIRSTAEADARTAQALAVQEVDLRSTAEADAAAQGDLRSTAEAAAAIAVTGEKSAEARELVALSQNTISQTLRLQLALAATELDGSQKAALRAAIENYLPPLLDQGNGAVQIAWSPDSQRFATAGDDNNVHLWDSTKFQPVGVLTGHTAAITSIVWSPDGSSIVSTSADGRALVWDLAKKQPRLTLSGDQDPIVSAAWSPDGQRIVSTGTNRTIQIWNAVSGEQILSKATTDIQYVSWAAWNLDGTRIVTFSGATATIWNADTLVKSGEPISQTSTLLRAAWSPDGTRILTADQNQEARVWDVRTRQRKLTLSDNMGFVNTAFWSPDGQFIVTASNDGKVRTWQAITGKKSDIRSVSTMAVNAAIWSPDGNRILTASVDGSVSTFYPSNLDANMLILAAKALVQELSPDAIKLLRTATVITPAPRPTSTVTPTDVSETPSP